MIEDRRLFALPSASTLHAVALRASVPGTSTLRPGAPGIGTPGTSTLRASHVSIDRAHLAAGMTATLFAELDGRVSPELIAEIVRAVLDENRRTAQDALAESAMPEARARLERFIRARAR